MPLLYFFSVEYQAKQICFFIITCRVGFGTDLMHFFSTIVSKEIALTDDKSENALRVKQNLINLNYNNNSAACLTKS